MKVLSKLLRLITPLSTRVSTITTTTTIMSSTSSPPAGVVPPPTAKFEDPKFVTKQVNDYVLKVGHKESSVAEELRLETAKHPRCRMMGDPIEASMFKVLLPAIGAKRIIEVGVYTGYTTLIMADAVGSKGKIIACDINEDFINIGKPYWEKANVTDRIDLRIGPATETLQKLVDDEGMEGTFDFAFIDADKTSYKSYYELLLKLIRPNGIIAIDNVLWSGRVLDPEFQDQDTLALREISEHVHNDDRVEHVMLPFADGVTLVRKK